ncbi:glycosyltransferase [Salinarimonas soli]|uniref:Glycosyltransferase family 4 protein n=1 Tax=Salinarimonas soli TaxID=1638099 RepID=A0A5B2VIP0_9HYPH|nr:glycosyltransferase [Salinarimonas soli]KAA2238232.1 glycosyltransferase family 4 protein [Salinarimonas soli]
MTADPQRGRVAIVLKGYPRLSETFVAQELEGLEARGLSLEIWSLRRPTDRIEHPLHGRIRARRHYLPEYLYREPGRVARAAVSALRRPGLVALLRVFARDLVRDPSPGRLRRLGQAFVLARELGPAARHIHVHFLHTPGSVARYAALLTGRSWSFSAHAKDIWTLPDWEKREKIAASDWGVTCTAQGYAHLEALAERGKVRLVYHGLDLSRFPPPPQARAPRDGRDPADPVRIVTVGRAVAKKGFDDLLWALEALPKGLDWRCTHVGGGELLRSLKEQAEARGLADRVTFRGPLGQDEVVALLRESDLFVLPSKEARSGDRDGLPNVLMEAASQRLAILATDFAGIPEFIRPEREGVLVPPGDRAALARAMAALAADPARRAALGAAAHARLVESFSAGAGLDELATRLHASLGAEAVIP